MRVLLFLIPITLILSCSEQPLMYEHQTRLQQGVPSGQIGPQIDTLFSSWKEFANDPYPSCMSILNRHYKNQMDNGLFGLPMGTPTFFSNVTKDTEKWAQYKSLTFSFTFVTTGLFDRFFISIDLMHYDGTIWIGPIYQNPWPFLGPNDSSRVSCTVYLDSTCWLNYSYKDLNSMYIGYYNYWRPESDTNLIYSAYVSELLVTAERRSQEVSGKGE